MSNNQGTPSKMRYVVRLSCDHVLYFESPSPAIGSDLLCTRCRNYRHVLTSELEWSLRCLSCGHSRRFGADPEAVRRAANQHLVKRPTHRVQVIQGATVRDRLYGPDSTLAGWAQVNAPHQESLRSLSFRDR